MARSRSSSELQQLDRLSGQVVVFTGHFSQTRDIMEDIARRAGATVGRNVTPNTTVLVLGRPSAQYKFGGYGLKIEQARSIVPNSFIAEISEETFHLLVDGRRVKVSAHARPLISAFGVPAVVPEFISGPGRKTTSAVMSDALDRATKEHHDTVRKLCADLRNNGYTPLSPGTGMPAYDLAVAIGRTRWVIEVKSIRPGVNEVEQVRLGVGQVLHYVGDILDNSTLTPSQVKPVVVTSQPADQNLVQKFRHAGVRICHPDNFVATIHEMAAR